MRPVFLTPFFLLSLFVIAAARNNARVECPVLTIDGFNVMVKQGETVTLNAKITPRKPEWQIKYNWHLSYGNVLSGQSTSSITVEKPPSGSLTVTVEIAGGPDDSLCPRVHAETVHWDAAAEAEKVTSIRGASLDSASFIVNRVKGELLQHPTNELYVFVGFKPGTSDEAVTKREADIEESLSDKIEKERMSMVRVEGSVDVTEFWRIPPGAGSPKCDECTSVCPKIAVFGPAGIIEPGRTAPFTVSIEPDEPSRTFSFEWTVLGGSMVGRRDTRTWEVRPERYFNKEITASVIVRGLPDGCPNTASASFGTACDSYLVMAGDVSFWTQYFEVSWQEERKNLDSLVLEGLKSHPRRVIYLEKTFGKNASLKDLDARIRRIGNYLTRSEGSQRASSLSEHLVEIGIKRMHTSFHVMPLCWILNIRNLASNNPNPLLTLLRIRIILIMIQTVTI